MLAGLLNENINQFFGIFIFTFFSEDIACITAGSLASQSKIHLLIGISASTAGILIGDFLLYAIGFIGGRPILKSSFGQKIFSSTKIENAEHWLKKNGGRLIFTSRFVPGMRLPTYLMAGILKMPFVEFIFYLVLAAIIWTPLLVVTAYYTGNWLLEILEPKSAIYRFILLVIVVFSIWISVKLITKMTHWKGRRVLQSRLQRILKWEFWPMQILYLPVGFYLLYLAFRHKRLLAFTACNPAIFASGIRDESKSEILLQLMPSKKDFGNVAEFVLIEKEFSLEKRLAKAIQFMKITNASFPVVLKPDRGERGNEVIIATSQVELEKYLQKKSFPIILQKYISGLEFGVFYYRYPSEKNGNIFAITDKRLLTLTGDGKSTLEELILKDGRAYLMANFHFTQHEEKLQNVLAMGERFPLVTLGTHCKGALFLEGKQFITEKLTEKIDEISKNFKGFYFGRYDIRVPNAEDFIAGKNIYVLELNGVTSEATSMYDPKYSIFQAYKTLFTQWRIAVEIGCLNIQNGARQLKLKELIRMAIP